MNRRISATAIVLLTALLAAVSTACQTVPDSLPAGVSRAEAQAMVTAMGKDPELARLVRSSGSSPWELLSRFKASVASAAAQWEVDQAALPRLGDIGTTRRFELLPLIDWYTDNAQLAGESGVSYLIRTDEATILFDVGFNSDAVDPSPLLRNMARLGVRLEDIDVFVLSHPHGDHLGGGWGAPERSFSLTARPIDLGAKRIYTPVPMSYPGRA